MIKGRFFQSIQNEAGAEEGVEEHVQGTVEVVVGDGLAEYSNAFLRAVVEVFRDLDGVGRDDFAVDSSFLDTVSHTGVVEAGVGEGEDEAATGFDDLANAAHQGVDLGHVHDRHVADGSVEARFPEGDDLVFAGGIDEAVFDAVVMFGGAGASMFKKLFAEIGGDNVDTKLSHAAGEDPVAAGDLEHGFAGLQVEQALARGTDEDALEVVAVAHLVVPKCGILIPNGACFFIQINWLGGVFGSHSRGFPFWYVWRVRRMRGFKHCKAIHRRAQ